MIAVIKQENWNTETARNVEDSTKVAINISDESREYKYSLGEDVFSKIKDAFLEGSSQEFIVQVSPDYNHREEITEGVYHLPGHSYLQPNWVMQSTCTIEHSGEEGVVTVNLRNRHYKKVTVVTFEVRQGDVEKVLELNSASTD